MIADVDDRRCPVCDHVWGLHSGPGATACRPGTCHGGPTDGPKGRTMLDCGRASIERDELGFPVSMPGTYCGWHPDLPDLVPEPSRIAGVAGIQLGLGW